MTFFLRNSNPQKRIIWTYNYCETLEPQGPTVCKLNLATCLKMNATCEKKKKRSQGTKEISQNADSKF